jgi:hypothetical protein
MTTPASRTEKIAIISVFFALLLLPIIQMVTRFPTVSLLDEHRNRERAPRLGEILSPVAFVSQAQKWFADHYGYRDWLIRRKHKLIILFSVSRTRFISGKKGGFTFGT